MLAYNAIRRSDVGRNSASERLPTIRWVSRHGLSRREPMDRFTAEQARTWDAWQHANAESARRGEHIARLAFGVSVAAAALAAIAAAMWR